MKNCVYRFLNSDNEIIYIGKAKDLKLRLAGHTHLPEECYKERVKIEYTTFSTIDEVDMAERYLISKIKPKYNIEFKSKELVMTIDIFENLQWIEYNSKDDTIIDFKTKKEIVKIDLDIQKINAEIESVRNKMEALDIMKTEILESNGKGLPLLIDIDENTRYHIYYNDKPYKSNKVNKNSKDLEEYAKLYEKWWSELDKESELLEKVDKLKDKKIDLLLKLNNKTCNEEIKDLYKEHDSIDDEFILNIKISLIEDKYKKQLSEDIINYGYYDYNKFIQNIDSEFIYDKYIISKRWLKLIDNIELIDVRIKYADDIINNVETYLEYLFGTFKLDTIVKNESGMYNYERVLPTAYLVKKPINI